MDDATVDRLRSALADRYHIGGELGRGGMARVFRATDIRHDRPVAIKALREEICALLGPARFEREIAIAARLQHPHIVPLFDSGNAGGILYYVMPVVEGESLTQRLAREKQLAEEEAVGIACDVAGALTYAHQQGVIHRDVKPGNILLSQSGAMLSDFGIARALATVDTDELTDSGIVPGTPTYMSPEQASGAPVDGRSDLYSLGCVLHEMLTGDPPFRANTVPAVLAQHALAPPPSIEIIRPTVSPSVATATRRMLAKVPADRFETGTAFVAALRAPAPIVGQRRRSRAGTWLVAAAAIVTGALGVVRFWPSGESLNEHRVVVFPLATTDTAMTRAGAGWDVALAIGAALEHTEPLRWLDGWTYLPETLRTDPQLLEPATARRVSRDRGARYYLDGVIRFVDQAPTIALRLYDVAGDTLIAQATVEGTDRTALATLGMGAVTQLLPHLLAPGRPVDLAPLMDRAPGAIALSIQGDRAYRRSRFAEALAFYRRAVEADSLLALAAVKGAEAASWENRYEEAKALTTHAAAMDDLLPVRYRRFVSGWSHFLAGAADSAVTDLTAATDADPEWPEPAMALGEVYYHLLPTTPGPLDSLAEGAFRTALAIDSLFVPALFHLAELAVRGGRLEEAERLVARIEAADPDPEWLAHVRAMLACARARPGSFPWTAAGRDPDAVLLAARAQAVTGAQAACAESGFRYVLGASDADPPNRWGALMGLQGVLLAQGRYPEATALLDSARSAGSRGVYSLSVLDDLAGAPLSTQARGAEELARRATDEVYTGAAPATRLLLGAWNVQQGDTGRTAALVRAMRADGTPAWIRNAVEAHLLAARGDSIGAIGRLEAILTTPAPNLVWDVSGPLAPERMLLATLLFRRGDYAGADRVASVFDHHEPVVFLPFLPRSLALRYRAAEARGLTQAAGQYRDRLSRLGWSGSALDGLLDKYARH